MQNQQPLRQRFNHWLRDPVVWVVVLLLTLTYWLPYSHTFFGALFPDQERPVYLQEPIAELLW